MSGWKRILAVIVVWAGAGTAFGEGLYWESTTSGIGNEARTTQTYAMPKMLKIVSGNQTTILRADRDQLVQIDSTKKTYREMTVAEVESAANAMHAQMETVQAEMAKRMKDMSPEQRAMMEKMMPQLPGAAGKAASQAADIVVKNTGETKTIAGYTCTKYVASEGDKPLLVAWTTKDVKGFEGLREDWLAFQKRTARISQGGADVAEAFAKIEGFPMRTEMGQMKTEVTKVEARAIPASEFDPPAGYKKEAANLPKVGGH